MDATLIVRVSRDAAGVLHGVVERVKTGTKERFRCTESLPGLIERMVEDCPAERPRKARKR